MRISFLDFSILRDSTYIGLDNYVQMLGDSRLRVVYGNTIIFTLFAVFFNAGIGLVLAVMLNRRLPILMRNIYRSVFFFPVLIAHTYIAVIWRFLYSQDTGVINYYLSFLGIDPIPWLSNVHWAMAAIIILDVWKNTGFAMLVFLAGLQSIRRSITKRRNWMAPTNGSFSSASPFPCLARPSSLFSSSS